MSGDLRVLAAAGALLCVSATNGAFAQTKGGILKSLHFDSPASFIAVLHCSSYNPDAADRDDP